VSAPARPLRNLCALALWWLLACCVPAGAQPQPQPQPVQEINAALRQSWVQPDAAVAALERHLMQGSSAERALAAWSLGQVLFENQAGPPRLRALLVALASHEEPLLRAAGELLLTLRLHTNEHREQAGSRLDNALAAFETAAPGDDAALAELHCDALRLQARLLALQPGKLPEALDRLRAAARLAERAGGRWRQALAQQERARLLAEHGQPAAALAAGAAVLPLIEAQEDLMARASLWLGAARLANLAGERDAARHASEQALNLARQAQAKSLQAQALLQQAVQRRLSGQAVAAAAAVDAALHLAQAEPPVPWQPQVRAAAGLELIRLGQPVAGRAHVEDAVWGAQRRRQPVLEHDAAGWLRGLDVALREAGDARGAVAVYHREREMRSSLQQRDLEAATSELEFMYRGQHQRREIELLNRENAHKAATRDARRLQEQALWLAAALLALGLGLATLLYRRQHAAHRSLAARETLLRTQSECDALTGLANRRHLQARLQALGLAGPQRAFEGALLMLDVDRFKQINDRHGHAVGDEMLVEVARRLSQVVRGSSDLAVRWGGEEFLLFAPALPATQVGALAERLVRAMDAEPLQLGELRLPIGVSVGYAHFPLPPLQQPLSWERAVNLTDLALYAAKRSGRGCSCGIVALHAEGEAALAAVEADFDAACEDGRVGLERRG
jgi:diguanylate cyclase (GGDEF)-like protein